jgi:formamidopyrimidine-DNA glycosylase
MPELPEVEVLVRYLNPRVGGKEIGEVTVHRVKSVRPGSVHSMRRALEGAIILGVRRRAKYLLFELKKGQGDPFLMLGHLGMTGRMYVQPVNKALPKHAAVSFQLGRGVFIFEDTRYFGRLTLDARSLDSLGPEPLSSDFSGNILHAALSRCKQAIKPKLLDQSLLAGVGNIYASEALWQARISPRKMSRRLTLIQCEALAQSIREVLTEAIECGSTVPLDFTGEGEGDGVFYYGSQDEDEGDEERLMVYDGEGEPCERCATPILKIVQAARSTFFCSKCQRG